MKMLLVGGTFDLQGGKSSKIISRMSEVLICSTLNGGSLEQLHKIDFKQWNVLIWMPNVDNRYEKILPNIKNPVTGNHKLLLISSKNAMERDYMYSDFVGRMLQTKSNLGIYIEEVDRLDKTKKFSLFDPLGNVYIQTTKIEDLCSILTMRINFLQSLTRIGSKSIGLGDDFEVEKEFIEVIHRSSDQFSKFVNANNPNRLLGNASTRCASGFPAIRDKDRILVTKRNVDKRELSNKDFVEAKSAINTIFYYGVNKPSVDTAIQLKLFTFYRNINYMIHGHVYIKDAPITHFKIPCGYLEEFNEVVKYFPDRNLTDLFINLRGHGCLVASDEIEKLRNVKFIGRSFPEN